MKIICDTNIWYKLYNDRHLIDRLTEHELVLTFNTLNEFAKSPTLYENPIFYKGVSKIMLEYSDVRILHNPFHHIKMIDDKNWIPDTKLGVDFIDMLKNLTKAKDDNVTEFVKKEKAKLENSRKEINAGLEQSTNFINQLASEVRKNAKKLSKNEYRNLNLKEDAKELVSLMVFESTKSNISDEFDWSQIELFVTIIEIFFKDLVLQANSKIELNDWIDLFNLAYVSPSEKYWTYEKSWNSIITDRKKNRHLKHYLFNPI